LSHKQRESSQDYDEKAQGKVKQKEKMTRTIVCSIKHVLFIPSKKFFRVTQAEQELKSKTGRTREKTNKPRRGCTK